MLTIEERKKYHKELWTWLGENPDTEKGQWPGWNKIEWKRHSCFLCGVYQECNFDSPNCNCPIVWIENNENTARYCECEHPDSPYRQWREAIKGSTERAKLAFKIAKMWK